MKSAFSDLGISPPILRAIEEMGFELPTEVQSRAIPHILKQEDLVIRSKTGSGKTAVFGVPMLQLTDPQAPGPQGLILTPTRELAVQVDSDLKQMAKYLEHRTTAVFGQHNINTEISVLNKGTSIVTGTPGRVYDHICHQHLDTRHVRFLVLDEADRMLDMGFLDQVVRIIKKLPQDRVTLLCSATIPDEVHKVCRQYMKHPQTIEIASPTKTVDTTQQLYYRVAHNEKNMKLNRVLMMERPESCLIFCNQRSTVNRVQNFLSRRGYASQALHGDIPQAKRLRTIQQFKQGDFHLLVATDVAARGIQIDDLALVINYDVPLEKDGYVHRIGRTGRAGNTGRAITLVTGDDIMSLYEIEEHIGSLIMEAEFPPESFFSENRAAIDRWIKANTQAGKPRETNPPSPAKGGQPKRSSTRPRQHRNERRNVSNQANRDHQTALKANTLHPAEQAQPVPVKAEPITPETVPSPKTTIQKPLFKRVLQRLLGRSESSDSF
jgi:superfamily II DNA/RNA helicase